MKSEPKAWSPQVLKDMLAECGLYPNWVVRRSWSNEQWNAVGDYCYSVLHGDKISLRTIELAKRALHGVPIVEEPEKTWTQKLKPASRCE